LAIAPNGYRIDGAGGNVGEMDRHSPDHWFAPVL
jgi:hypothetical protein